ncbi:hypothetical protein OG271_13025 [Micromonospora rifamycinica]|uniref:hypothetical protein n=1 Tax=Micromonospora rifamycinica TaxID=291594 RepID=UPI002E27B541|nr:hypothetical protein [Micromonospora rifamycinica]
MVTSRLPDSTGAAAPAVADGFPVGPDGGAVVAGDVAGAAGVVPEGVAVTDGVPVPDAASAGFPAPSPQATSVPRHARTATGVTHFTFTMLCSIHLPARVRGVHCALPPAVIVPRHCLDAGDPPPVSPYPGRVGISHGGTPTGDPER